MQRANKTYIDYFKEKGVEKINGNSNWEQLLEQSFDKFGLMFGLKHTCEQFGNKTYIKLYKEDDVIASFVRDNNDVWDEKENYWRMDVICKFLLSYLMSTNCCKRKTKKFDKYMQ